MRGPSKIWTSQLLPHFLLMTKLNEGGKEGLRSGVTEAGGSLPNLGEVALVQVPLCARFCQDCLLQALALAHIQG